MLIFSILAILILIFWCGWMFVNRHQSKTKMIDAGIFVFSAALAYLLVDDIVRKF